MTPRSCERIDRDRDGLLVFFVCIILFRVAAAVYFLAHLLVAAAPVVVLARRVTVPQLTSNATRRVVGQWGGAGGAICEDHFAFLRRVIGLKRLDSAGKTRFVKAKKTTPARCVDGVGAVHHAVEAI